jgi:thiol-disulfide isomerase/thioredoxin
MTRPLVRGLVALLAIACVVSFAGSSALAGASPMGNTKGAKAPEVAITDGIFGVTATTKLADYAGSPTLVVIWLPICPHCQKFMPEVHKLHQKYAARGLKILTVTHGRKDYTKEYMDGKGWSFGTGFDWTGTTSSRFGVTGLPGIRLVGADGHLRNYTGTLEQAILEELPPPAR